MESLKLIYCLNVSPYVFSIIIIFYYNIMTSLFNDVIDILINEEINKLLKHHHDNKERLYFVYKCDI